MKGSLLLHNLKLNCLIFFSTSLNSSIFIWTYTVNYRNALDRLRVRMNIILLRNAATLTQLHIMGLPIHWTISSILAPSSKAKK